MTVALACVAEDKAFADRLLRDLEGAGISAELVVERARTWKFLFHDRRLSALRHFVPILSRQSIDSRALRDGITSAFKQPGSSIIIPLLTDPCEVTDLLGLRVPVDFSQSYDGGLANLVAQLRAANRVSTTEPASRHSSAKVAERIFRVLVPHLSSGNTSTRLFLDSFVTTKLRQEYPDCGLEILRRDHGSGIDVILLGGRDLTIGPWLLQFKCVRSGTQAAIEAVDSIVPVFAQSLTPSLDPDLVFRTLAIAESFDDPFKSDPAIHCWRMEPPQLRVFYQWLERTPELGHSVVQPVEEARERYSELVDRQLLGALSDVERVEKSHLEGILDTSESDFYAATKERLRAYRPDDQQQRYSELVDQRFSVGLTPEEERELQEVSEGLDADEASYYEPMKQHLRTLLQRHTR